MPIVERLVDRLAMIFHSIVGHVDDRCLQSDDEGSQQRQEAAGCPHCCACIRDHPPPHGPEPNPSLAVSRLLRIAPLTYSPTRRSSLTLLLTLALAKIQPVSALKVLSVDKLLTFHRCGESTKPSHFSPLAYVQPCNCHSSRVLILPSLRHATPHSVTLNQSQSASRMNSSTRQRVLRTHMPSRFVIPTLNFRCSFRATLPTEKGRT